MRGSPPHGVPAARATPAEGTPHHPAQQVQPPREPGVRTPPGAPIPPGAPTRPIVHAASGPEEPPRVWGRPPTSPQPRVRPREPEPDGDGSWSGASDVQDPYSERESPRQGALAGREGEASSTGPLHLRETSGVQVRLGSREREEERLARRRAGRRSGLVAAGVLVLAGLVTVGLVLTRGSGDGDGDVVAGERSSGAGADVRLPAAGAPVEVGTADGSRYRLAAVTSGVSDGAAAAVQSEPPAGTAFPYIEYMLGNPTNEQVLLDFPGDVFVKRELVTPEAQGRCMPQAGVPEDMCTPPTKSTVVRRLAGGELIDGEGGDKYLAPGGTYLVRATVDVPVKSGVTRKDMGLYVWKQLYMADRLAKQVPFPG
ncbi:hypothetical protein E1281_27185 [Actinomadura sp. KC345]|uniref:hypothetical protein n=1 Tax=Actinomadura sp. KC345 TaxID=2530371 RepID=UPI0010D3D725|nr:hypothetical protein [Actinomadura sp. KC345]TDC46843.1 hypothetical protein E1281_27185 [Actinomadura sp. KC345]